MGYEKLTSKQRYELAHAKTPEEVLAFAKEAGVELSDEELKAVSASSWKGSAVTCECGHILQIDVDFEGAVKCPTCGESLIVS